MPDETPRFIRRGPLMVIVLVFLFLPSNAAAIAKGVISGTVTDSSGPVSNVRVLALLGGGYGIPAEAHTDGSGHYSVEAWPGTYRVAVLPPSGSADGFASQPEVVLPDGGSAVANVALPPAGATAHLSGVASYADHSPDAGIEIQVGPERYESGAYQTETALTDEGGHWDIGSLATGIYRLFYWVVPGGSLSQQGRVPAADSEVVFLEENENRVVVTTLTGPKPGALVNGTVMAAEGWPSREAQVDVSQTGGGSLGSTEVDKGGGFRIRLLTGSYRLSATGGNEEDDGTGETTISVTAGQASSPTIQMPGKPVPAGLSAQRSQQDLAWLNQQRSRWGLPAGIGEVPLWSRACAAHDAYGVRNGVLEHQEQDLPGHSPGGRWAGAHAILAAAGGWGPEETPWNDAPIHYDQLMTPGLSAIGLDANGQACATTWPGILRGGIELGTIFTFPGDGTTGLPPAEDAAEIPTTPNEVLGVPQLAGRELFVYEFGTERTGDYGYLKPLVLSASLTSPGGSVPVKWTDGESEIGGYLTGAIIVPTEPLQPFTTYTATVGLSGVESFYSNLLPLPPVTHTWTFETGHANPDGSWGGRKEKPRGPQRVVRTGWAHGHVVVRGWHFKPGEVVIRRKVLLRGKRRFDGRVLARAPVSAKGKFLARFPWPRKRIAFRVYENGKSTFGIYNPPQRRRDL